MKNFQRMLIVGTLLFLTLVGIAYATSRNWVCEFCGRRVNADNMPGVQYCDKNPFGNTHRWRAMD